MVNLTSRKNKHNDIIIIIIIIIINEWQRSLWNYYTMALQITINKFDLLWKQLNTIAYFHQPKKKL